MNELRKFANSIFHREPQAPKEMEQHDLDRGPPAVRIRLAQPNETVMEKKSADGPARQDAPRTVATRPSYQKAAQVTSSQVAQSPALASSPRPDAGTLFAAVDAGDLATVRKCIADGVDLASLTPKPEQPAIRMALKSRNLEMIKLLLPISSHADKLEALALVIETHRAHRNGLKPGVAAILDSVNRANLNDAGWEKRQEEIIAMTKLLARFQ
jgi:hypothetical protein